MILHAGFVEGGLWFWGERWGAGASRRRRATAAGEAPALPAAASAAEVAGAILGCSTSGARRGLRRLAEGARTLTIWLPTAGGRPASPSSSAQGADLTLAPWSVPAVRVEGRLLPACLRASMGVDELPGGERVGSSLAFWAAASRFAGSLVARGMVTPSAEADAAGLRAVWQPVVAGDDADLMASLAACMPGVCRAAGFSADIAPEVSARGTLGAFTTHLADLLLRSSTRIAAVGASYAVGRRRARAPICDRWLAALASDAPGFAAEPAEARGMLSQIREWRRPLTSTVSAPFRLTFRLEEPEDDGAAAGWFVRYLLRSVEDPSLLIEAECAWTGSGSDAWALERPGFSARECVLSSLGRAARVCPEIGTALRESAGARGHRLTTAGAVRFLESHAIELRRAGFHVLLPGWWARRGPRERLTLRGELVEEEEGGGVPSGGVNLDVLAPVAWQLVLGEHRLSAEDLERLAAQKEGLISIRGKWVHLTPDESAAAVGFWRQVGEGPPTVGSLVRMAVGASPGPGGLPVAELTGSGAISALLGRMVGRIAPEEAPLAAGLRAELRPYQRRGVTWLEFMRGAGLGACLADDMGLGKTLQLLAVALTRGGAGPTLVVCPTSVVGNWRREAARFAPDLRVHVHHGPDRLRGRRLADAAAGIDLMLTSYALLQRDAADLRAIHWGAAVMDEAQNIKNPETQQSRAARGLKSEWRVAMTGTPVENHVGDLWAVMEFLNPGLLGSRTVFRETFHRPIHLDRDTEAAARLKRITGPFILRRVKTDRSIISDLPEKIEMKDFCNLTQEQATLYQATVNRATEEIETAEGMARRGAILAALTRLKQVCNHPAHLLRDNSELPGRSGKLDRLTEMMEEVASAGEKALVFTQFAEMGEMLCSHLSQTLRREVLFLYGGVPKARRDEMVDRFQEDAAVPVFVLSVKAGGVGLNLTAANHVFHFDRWWNPAVENQATDRAFRIGQTRNVQVHKMICAGTVEERIDALIESKSGIAGAIVGAGEQWLTELSTAELRVLFALAGDAVGD